MQTDLATIIVIASWLIFIGFGGLLSISLKRNKFRLLNGILGNMTLIVLAITVILTVVYSQIQWLEYGILILAVIILIPIFIIYLALGFCYCGMRLLFGEEKVILLVICSRYF